MEKINIGIKNGNVNIESDCSPESMMNATTVMFASLVLGSSNTVEELLAIIEEDASQIIKKGKLQEIKKEEK